MSEPQSFFEKNEFLIRRLHSLSGLIPVGAFMCVHLITNASVLNGTETFQNAVYQIHALGSLLWIVEWLFIFFPILFHGIVGVLIIMQGKSNVAKYRYGGNVRYWLQRISGMIAFVFIFAHVFHMHGWFHTDVWLKYVAEPLGGHQFVPYKATSTAATAMQVSILIPIAYAIGVIASVYHFANGVWTMGITWGVWTSPGAQKKASYVALALGLGLGFVGLSAIAGFSLKDAEKAEKIEVKMYEHAIEARRIYDDPKKFYGHGGSEHDEPEGEQTESKEEK